MLLPGLAAPPIEAPRFMIAAGIAWAVFAARPRRGRPDAATAGNFLRAVPFAAALSLGDARQPASTRPARSRRRLRRRHLGLGYVLW